MNINHPYKNLENTTLWKLINTTIEELINNRDLELTTKKEYVVGFLCKKIIKNKKILENFENNCYPSESSFEDSNSKEK